MASRNEESIELEVKHKVNASWHPCRVSLSSIDSKFGIVVDFENSEEEDIIYDREDALTRLRFRSAPLQNSECSHIKEGDCVLATALYKDQFKSLFYDAVIEKTNRVKHSNRVFCRCNFEIKWLYSELKDETMTIPSKSIMKLSREKIGSDPIFASFLNALSPNNVANSPSLLSSIEEINYEDDINQMLEKQIEEISKLADGVLMDSTTELSEVKRAIGGYKQSKAAATSQKGANNNQNSSRRSTRSQKKEKVEMEIKKVQEDDKTFLSPLAARAALASLVHEQELPVKGTLSEDIDMLRKSVSKDKIKNNSIKVTCSSANKEIETLSDVVKSGPSRKKITTHVSTARKTRSSMGNKQEVPVDVVKKESPIEKLASPITVNNSTEGLHNINMLQKSVSKDKMVNNPTKVTRSSANKEIETLSDEVKSGPSKEKIATRVSATRKNRSSMCKELELSLDEVKKESLIEKLASPITVNASVGLTRVTRSSVKKDIEALSEEVVEGSSKEKLIGQNARLTHSRNEELRNNSKDVTPDMSEKKKRRSISSPADYKMDIPSATTSTANSGMEDIENAASKKKKTKKVISSEKPQLRSSPRLNFSPQTRSQK